MHIQLSCTHVQPWHPHAITAPTSRKLNHAHAIIAYTCIHSTSAKTVPMHMQQQHPRVITAPMNKQPQHALAAMVHVQPQCLCACNCSTHACAITACRCNHSLQTQHPCLHPHAYSPMLLCPMRPHTAAPRAGTQLPPSPLHTQSPDTQAYFYCICQEHEKPFCQHSARAIYEPGLSEEGVGGGVGIREEMMGEKMAHKLFAMIYTVVHLQPILFLEPHTQISLSSLLHFGVLSWPSWRKAAIRVQLVQTELK